MEIIAFVAFLLLLAGAIAYWYGDAYLPDEPESEAEPEQFMTRGREPLRLTPIEVESLRYYIAADLAADIAAGLVAADAETFNLYPDPLEPDRPARPWERSPN